MKSNGKRLKLLKELSCFSIPSYKKWRYMSEKSLKGAPFNTLFTPTYENIPLRPIYHYKHQMVPSQPAVFPYRRGTKAVKQLNKAWEISQELSFSTPEKFNEEALHALQHGQTTLNIVLDDASKQGFDPDEVPEEQVGKKGLSIASIEDIEEIFQGINLVRTPLFIHAGALSLPIFILIQAYFKNHSISPAALQGTIAMDPLGMLASNGFLQNPLDVYYDSMAKIVQWSKQNSPSLRTVLVEGHPYHDGGASVVEELAFSIAGGVEYLRALLERGVSIEAAASSFAFSFSIGSNFFMEIAKFRAARVLWASVIEAFGGSNKSAKMWIHAKTSAWNKSSYDPYVNMIRSSVEAFSAAVSDIDSLHISPFNESFHSITSFSQRIARNTHFILQEEAHFNKIVDPAGGSAYVEALTDSIAEKSWSLFQKVEAKGGLYKALKLDFPQQKVNETAKKREDNIQKRKDIIVGANKYVNLQAEVLPEKQNLSVYEKRVKRIKKVRRMKENLPIEIDQLIGEINQGVTLGMIRRAIYKKGPSLSIPPIPKRRASTSFEKLRLASIQYANHTNGYPKAFLANIGAISSYRNRVDFAVSFIEAGGFEVLSNGGYKTIEEALNAIRNAQPQVVIICSNDERYPLIIPPFMNEINRFTPCPTVLLTGQPNEEEKRQYTQLGIFDFLNKSCHAYEFLLKLQKERGMQ